MVAGKQKLFTPMGVVAEMAFASFTQKQKEKEQNLTSLKISFTSPLSTNVMPLISQFQGSLFNSVK